MHIQTIDYQADNAPHFLAQSLRETGFAVLRNHPITPARIEAIYASWGSFFASEGKQDYLRKEHGGAVDVMMMIKSTIDPKGIMNPGKIL